MTGDDATGRLEVRRPHVGLRDRLARYRLVVDGTPRGTMRPGGSVVVDLPAGRHVVRVRIGASGSPDVEVDVPPGASAVWYVGPARSTVEVGRVHDDGYLALVRDPEKLPEPTLQASGEGGLRMPRPVAVLGGLVVLVAFVPRLLPALRSGDALRTTGAVVGLLFLAWFAWTIARPVAGDRSAMRRRTRWWAAWLAVGVVLVGLGWAQHRLGAAAWLLLVVPALGGVGSLLGSRRAVARSGGPSS